MTDLVLKTFSFRIKDATSGKRLTALSDAVNTVWNYVNEISTRSAERGSIWATKKQLRDLTRGSGKLRGLPSQVVQEVTDEHVIKRKAARRPKLRWRASRGPKRALGWVPFTNQDLAFDGAAVLLRGQHFRLWLHRAVEGRIKSGNFSQDARGRWYCNLVCEVPRRQGSGPEEFGVDLGLKSAATCSDGTALEQARFYRDLEPKLAEAQRRKRKRQMKSLHAKIANRRKDTLHKFSQALVDRAAIHGWRRVGLGDDEDPHGKERARRRMIDATRHAPYKCDYAGVAYAEVNEANRTRTCSFCGCLSGPTGLAGLSIRRWTCSACGSDHDRDQNAARNIARLGCETPCPSGHGSSIF